MEIGKKKTSTAIAERSTATAVTNLEKNYFEQLGEELSIRGSIVGQLLKFVKGSWLAGQDETEIASGTRFVVSLDNALHGWVKWVDGRPVDERLGLISMGFQPVPRSNLGDEDSGSWELDPAGRPRDPWTKTVRLLLKPVGKQYSESIAMTLNVSSKTGLNAMGALLRKIGSESRARQDENPIIELGDSFYNDQNFGKVKIPVFALVGWEKGSLFEKTADVDAEPAPEPAPKRRRGR